uniref:Uncharacterized protein n=1 Tax=viral metagenome TaxID=1070528 RepID=A0A6C0AC87_9ZZZZ
MGNTQNKIYHKKLPNKELFFDNVNHQVELNKKINLTMTPNELDIVIKNQYNSNNRKELAEILREYSIRDELKGKFKKSTINFLVKKTLENQENDIYNALKNLDKFKQRIKSKALSSDKHLVEFVLVSYIFECSQIRKKNNIYDEIYNEIYKEYYYFEEYQEKMYDLVEKLKDILKVKKLKYSTKYIKEAISGFIIGFSETSEDIYNRRFYNYWDNKAKEENDPVMKEIYRYCGVY